jgi:DNA-binding NarL/FixJ family response regulator
MRACRDVSPKRRVTGSEEQELVAAAAKVKAAEAELEQRRTERERLIADLVDSNARVGDIAEILGLSTKAVRDARDRAHER